MKTKKVFKRILHISVWILVLGSSIALLSFVESAQDDLRCWKFNVTVDYSNGFHLVESEDVRQRIYNLEDTIIGMPLRTLDIAAMKKELRKMATIKEVQVYRTIDGQLNINIHQRTPILRILNQDGSSFYIDTEGNFIPCSTSYHARVPVLVGNIQEASVYRSIRHMEKANPAFESSKVPEAFELASFVYNDEFLRAQTDHLYRRKDGGYELIPRVGNHRILLGEAKDLKEKFKKLDVFYKNTIHNKDLNIYSTIDLRFRDQVVCTKKQ